MNRAFIGIMSVALIVGTISCGSTTGADTKHRLTITSQKYNNGSYHGVYNIVVDNETGCTLIDNGNDMEPIANCNK